LVWILSDLKYLDGNTLSILPRAEFTLHFYEVEYNSVTNQQGRALLFSRRAHEESSQ
jgi:hypothetical protein